MRLCSAVVEPENSGHTPSVKRRIQEACVLGHRNNVLMTLAKILLTSIGCLAWTISPWGADNVPRTAQADSSTRGAGSADQQQGSTEPQVSGEVKPSPTGEPSG